MIKKYLPSGVVEGLYDICHVKCLGQCSAHSGHVISSASSARPWYRECKDSYLRLLRGLCTVLKVGM